MKDLFLGLILGFVIGALVTIVLTDVIDFGAFAEVSEVAING